MGRSDRGMGAKAGRGEGGFRGPQRSLPSIGIICYPKGLKGGPQEGLCRGTLGCPHGHRDAGVTLPEAEARTLAKPSLWLCPRVAGRRHWLC